MLTFGLSQQQLDELWARWRRGESLRSIGRGLGIVAEGPRQIVAQTGGVRPTGRHRRAGHLSLAEREEISRGIAAGASCRVIAANMGRAASSVSREIARNGGRSGYRAAGADAAAYKRARRPQVAKLKARRRLREIVEVKLGEQWSPQQIAAWLRTQYPRDRLMRVSHETIYLSLFVQGRGALRAELSRQLRTGRAMRYPKIARQGSGRGRIKNMVYISERPAEVADRAVPGHWEGDLILGARPSAIGTLVERSSRYVMLFALPAGHTAEQVRPRLTNTIVRLPEQLRRSLTWDRGKEMAAHKAFTIDTGCQVYFCDPQSPWQRGSNENANGLLRQYLPKNTDLRRFSQSDLDAIAHRLNTRPRQTLGWRTPAQVFTDFINHNGHTGALTT